MSMSTHVVGFKAPDDVWHKMKAVYDACDHAGVNIPDEVGRYFNYEAPDYTGVVVDLSTMANFKQLVTEWSDDNRAGLQVNLELLPPGLTAIRFYNSF